MAATNINTCNIAGTASADARQGQYSTLLKLEVPSGGKGKAFISVNVTGIQKNDAAKVKEGNTVRVVGRLETYESNGNKGYSITQLSELRIGKPTGAYQKVILEGRLTRDTEPKLTQSGNTVTNFIIACDRTYKDRNGEFQTVTSFIPVQVWDTVRLGKGTAVYVSGEIITGSFEKDGAKVYTTQIRAKAEDIVPETLPKNAADLQEKEAAPVTDWSGENIDLGDFEELEDLPF